MVETTLIQGSAKRINNLKISHWRVLYFLKECKSTCWGILYGEVVMPGRLHVLKLCHRERHFLFSFNQQRTDPVYLILIHQKDMV